MLNTLLQPSAVTSLLHLLQAAQPFLTPCWCRLADTCIRLLNISELFSVSHTMDFSRLLRDVRGCSPSNDMSALLCAIRPFCSDEELRMLQMYEQFQQMQKMMDMWKMFSDLMPDAGNASGAASPFDSLAGLFGSGNGNNFGDIFSAFMNMQGTATAPTDTPFSTNQTANSSENSSANTFTTDSAPGEHTEESPNPLLSFLSPEQLALYNSILAD